MTRHRMSAAASITTAVTLFAAGQAGASKPERTLIPVEPFVIEDVCAFPVSVVPRGKDQVLTEFDDGRWTIHAHADPTLTNLSTGRSRVYRLRYVAAGTADGTRGTVSGQFNFALAPGDAGPSGIDPDGALLHFVGHLDLTTDPDTFLITSFSWAGTVSDICTDLG